ncbi:hypothetical protein Tco_1357428, partial [Tanacetum coccineum]
TEQGDSAAGGEDIDIQLVSERVDTVAEDVAPLQPRRQKKRKTMVVSAGEPSHPSKKLREDHETPSGTFVAGKSMSAVTCWGEREVGRPTDSLAGANLRTVSAPQRFVISSDSSHYSGTHVAETKVDSLIRSSAPAMTTITTVTTTVDAATVVKETPVKPSLFAAGSSSAGGTDPTLGGFSDLTGSDFLVGGVRTVIDPDSNLQKVYVEHSKIREKEIEDLKTQLLLKEAEAAEAIRLRAEASKFEVVEKSLRDEAPVLKERNITLEREKSELEVKVVDLAASVKVREQEVAYLDVVVTSVRSQNDNLVDQVHGLETSS